MAYDELQREPSELVADFIEHTAAACWDLQYYAGMLPQPWDIAPDPAISQLANVLSAFRAIARSGLDNEHQLVMRDDMPLGPPGKGCREPHHRITTLGGIKRDEVSNAGWRHS